MQLFAISNLLSCIMAKTIKKKTAVKQEAIAVAAAKEPNTLKDIGIILAVTGVVLNMVLSASVSSALSVLFKSSFKVPDEDTFEVIIKVFRLTAPLTIAIGLTLLAYLRDWFGAFGRLVFFTAVLVLATYLLMPEHQAILAYAAHEFKAKPGMSSFTVGLVVQYAFIYWWAPLLCSVVLGASFGFTSTLLLDRVWPEYP